MGIPPGLAPAVISTHRSVAREQVLDRSRQTVPRMRQTICGGRPFVEDKLGLARPLLQGALIDLLLLPELKDFFLQSRETDVVRYRGKHLA